jgi:predicted neutral ceramidase superfamily lipid hydrolase
MDLPFISGLSNIDILILLAAGIFFLIMAYMIFKQIMKAIIVGVISAYIPIVLYLLGFTTDISLQTIIWFALAGIATYFVYDVISGWVKILKILTWPIRRALRSDKQPKEKPKKEKEEKKPEKQKEEKKKKEEKNEEKGSDKDEDYASVS